MSSTPPGDHSPRRGRETDSSPGPSRPAPRWQPAPLPADEQDRLAELRSLRILDTAAEQRFDRITQLIADIFEVPIALVSLVDRDRQWFKSRHGLDAGQTPRDRAFCAHAILQEQVLVVTDATRDERFADNPLVSGPPHVRFYAGAVLRGPLGGALGTLCLIDRSPREFGASDQRRLLAFAQIVEKELEHRAASDELRACVLETSFSDPATGLPNRRLGEDRLGHALLHARETGEGVALLDIKLNEFAHAREALGSSQVDELLARIAGRLRERIGPRTTIARWHPEGLGIVTAAARAELTLLALSHANAIVEALEQPFECNGSSLHLTASVGIGLFPEHGDTAEALCSRAASARVFAAERRTTSVAMFESEISEMFREQFALTTRLPGAIARDELRLAYQPKVDLRSGLVVGAEALLRWHDSERGCVAPERFVPAAEATGAVIGLGRWTLDTAVHAAGDWNQPRAHPIPVAVNISPRHFRDPQLLPQLRQLLSQRPEAADWLQLEVTEMVLIEDPERVIATMRSIVELGVPLSLDDFGTGYSALSRLLELPVGELKLDRSFLAGLESCPRRHAFVRSIVEMAGALGTRVVAEGVETSEQLEVLRELGVDQGQGFLFSPAVDPEALQALFARKLIC